MLTKKQKNILDYIESFIQKNVYSPSLEEIKDNFKLSSVATVHEHIKNLKEKGYLSKSDSRQRTIEISRKENLVRIPLLGTIAAGFPIEVIGEYETITIPKSLLAKSGEHFVLRVQGNSMVQDGIFDGDNVINISRLVQYIVNNWFWGIELSQFLSFFSGNKLLI